MLKWNDVKTQADAESLAAALPSIEPILDGSLTSFALSISQAYALCSAITEQLKSEIDVVRGGKTMGTWKTARQDGYPAWAKRFENAFIFIDTNCSFDMTTVFVSLASGIHRLPVTTKYLPYMTEFFDRHKDRIMNS